MMYGTMFFTTLCASIVSQIHLSLYVLEIWKINTCPPDYFLTKQLLVPCSIRSKVQYITGPELFASVYIKICGKHVLTTDLTCFSTYSGSLVLPMVFTCRYSTHIPSKIFPLFLVFYSNQYYQYNI